MKKNEGILSSVSEEELSMLATNPSEFWKNIKFIGVYAFYDCRSLETIEIPEGIEKIDKNAFKCLYSLKDVKLPSTLKTIGESSFSHCGSLQTIEIPECVEKIDGYAFSYCSNLKDVKLTSGLKTIGESSFANCVNLEKIEIPEGVEKIGNYAFEGCNSLKEIKLPSTLKTIATKAFSDCKNLETIEIPEGVEKIDKNAFVGCSNLKNIKLPSTLKIINARAFYQCESLERIEIPEGVEKIDKNAFTGCKNLKEVKLSSALKTMGVDVFSECKNLEKIEVSEGVEKILPNAFKGCSSLKEVKLPSTLKEIGDFSFSLCSDLEKIEIPQGVEKIGKHAFAFCRNLKSVTLPDSINSISVDALGHCEKLKNFNFLGREWEASCDFFPTVQDIVENQEKIEEISKTGEWLKKQELAIPVGLINKDNLDEYLYNKEHKDMNKEYKYIKNLLSMIESFDRKFHLLELYKIASIMGVLENDSVKVKVDGKDVSVNAIAYERLQYAIKHNQLELGELKVGFQSLSSVKFNVEFLKFMTNKTNFKALLDYNSEHPDFLAKVYNWFEDRTKLDINNQNDGYSSLPSDESNRYRIKTYTTMGSGIDKIKWNVPTVDLFKKEFNSNKFSGMVDERSKEIGEYLAEFHLYEQRHFDKALEIDKERVESGVKDHLTSKIIKEDVVDSIEDYKQRVGKLKNDIAIELSDTLKTQTDTASKIFTYEMLAKSDKANFSIGFLTDCCATLYGAGAGAQRAMILHPDMQPLVIRNIKGEIVCFGIIYVNRKEGYAVVNDFELNKKRVDDEIREEIYTKAMQGVKAFVTQYNKENVNNPIKVVTCGLSPDWHAINSYIEQNPKSEILKAPNLGEFGYIGQESKYPGDWHKKQHVIWEMDKKAGDKR